MARIHKACKYCKRTHWKSKAFQRCKRSWQKQNGKLPRWE